MTKRPTTKPVTSHLKLAKVPKIGKATPGILGWLDAYIGYLLLGSGTIGAFASFMLVFEEYEFLRHPGVALGCDLNPILSCGAAMDTWQGHLLFGVPNAVFGLALFSAVATLGLVILTGSQIKRWLWQAIYAGYTFGLLFVAWFIYQSIYVLEHLCPFCMLMWIAIIPGFWYSMLYGIRAGHIPVPNKLQKLSGFMQRHHLDILVMIFLVILALILQHFWYFFAGE